MSRKRKVNFDGTNDLGYLEPHKGLMVIAVDYGLVRARELISGLNEPVYVVRMRGYTREADDQETMVLLRTGVVAQLISALIAVAYRAGHLERLATMISEEVRATTPGGLTFDVRRHEPTEN